MQFGGFGAYNILFYLQNIEIYTENIWFCQAQFQLTSQVTSRTDLALNLEITYPPTPPGKVEIQLQIDYIWLVES